jgi:hypothetical protein
MYKPRALLERKWLATVIWSLGALVASTVQAEPESVTRSDLSRPEFELEKGAGLPVCEAYLQRLNETRFEAPPFCGRPENSRIPGFSLLHRVPLAPAETARLYPRILSFLLVERSTQPHPLDSYATNDANSGGSGPVIFAWHYATPVDIDNDGAQRDVVVWTGPPVDFSNRPCGSMPEDPRLTQPLRRTQLAFVLENGSFNLDDGRTLATFGHPTPGTPQTQFRPLGHSFDIFRYRSETYFDTFLDAPLQDHLAVFVHRNGVTHQVCRYLYRAKRPVKRQHEGSSNE